MYNLGYGPWESEAWFHKHREAAGEYFWRADVADPLFNLLYPDLARDRGEEPLGTAAHKEALLKELANSPLFAHKGGKSGSEQGGSLG